MSLNSAVYKLSQKSCSNVNILASAVPKRVSCESNNTNDLSGAAFLWDVFFHFFVAEFLAHTSNKLKQIKTFVQCSLLEKLSWNAVGMSHEHWPHANFTRFWKNNLGYFWPRLPKVKVFYFWAFLAKDTNGESLWFFESFWPRIPMVRVFVFHGHFLPILLLLATLAINTNDESYVCDLRFAFE